MNVSLARERAATPATQHEWRPMVVLADIAAIVALWQIVARLINWRRSHSYHQLLSVEDRLSRDLESSGRWVPQSYLSGWGFGGPGPASHQHYAAARKDQERRAAVAAFRQDRWSRMVDCCTGCTASLALLKARTEASPCVATLRCVQARVALVWDTCGDIVVAVLLWWKYLDWAIGVCFFVFFPYAVLGVVLWPVAFDHMRTGQALLQELHMPLKQVGSRKCLAILLWTFLSVPYLLVVDVYLHLRYFFSEPKQVDSCHYMALRRIVQAFAEASFQLPLQLSVWVFNVLPGGASQNEILPWVLAISVFSSACMIYEVWTFLIRSAALQTHGSKRLFLARLFQLDRSLPPSVLLHDIERQSEVVVFADLSLIDSAGLFSMCKIAKNSHTLESLIFTNCSFFVRLGSDPEETQRTDDALRDLLRCPRLKQLEFRGAAMPRHIIDQLRKWLQQHPNLSTISLPQSHPSEIWNEVAENLDKSHPMIQAVWSGDAASLRAAFEGPVQGPESGCQPMIVHLAARHGNSSILRELLGMKDGPASANRQDHQGRSALHVAAEAGHVHATEVLLLSGSGVNATDYESCPPLLLAAREGWAEVVALLLDWMAELGMADQRGDTPLSTSAMRGHLPVVQVLLQRSLHLENREEAVDAPGREGVAPLFFAAQHGHLSVVEVLLDFQADVDRAVSGGATALYVASLQGHLAVVQMLLSRYAFLNGDFHDEDDLPLPLPASALQLAKIRLGRSGPNDPEWSRKVCKTPVFAAAEGGHVSVLHALIEVRAEVDHPMGDGATPLFIACMNGHMQSVQVLLNQQASVDHVKNSGATPLFVASQQGHAPLVQLLLEHHAAVNQAKSSGITAVHVAARHGHLACLQALMAKGAKINRLAKNGATSLLLASQSGHMSVVRALLASRADVNRPLVDGTTSLITAAYVGHEAICMMLLRHGADKTCMAMENPVLGTGTAAEVAEAAGHMSLSLALK